MIRRKGDHYLAALLFVVLFGIGPIPASAGGIVDHMAMGKAGVALPGGVYSVDSNPAGAADTRFRQVYMAAPFAETKDGFEHVIAYAEPHNGMAAGILAWKEERRATGPGSFPGVTFYDQTSHWTYVVATPLDSAMNAGVAVHYRSVESDERGDQGNGYRVDVGITRNLGHGLRAGVHIKGLADQGIRWSGGDQSREPRTVTVGGAWMYGKTRLAVDAITNAQDGYVGLRTGVSTHLGAVRLMAGVSTLSGTSKLSGGATYEHEATTIEYAYSEESGTHLAGLSWRF